MFKEFDVVRTIVDKIVPKGSVGTIVSVYSSGPACEVEFLDVISLTDVYAKINKSSKSLIRYRPA